MASLKWRVNLAMMSIKGEIESTISFVKSPNSAFKTKFHKHAHPKAPLKYAFVFSFCGFSKNAALSPNSTNSPK